MDSIDEVLAGEKPAFARAVKAIVTGNAAALRTELLADPALVLARSGSPHRATLLHYVAANGIEPLLQRQVANSDELAAMLLAAGAEVDATCDAYVGERNTTMDLLVSSDHPNDAGVAGKVVALLCAAGAAVDGLDHDGLPLAMALRFANLDCVEALITRGARLANIVFSAAAGRVDKVRAYLDEGDAVTIEAASALPLSPDRKTAAEQALVFASMCGRIETVRLLVERGVDINASPPGSHRTATPLHSAALQGQVSLIGFLLDKGADPTIKDARYQGTPLGWTSHARGSRKALAQQAAILLSKRS